MSEKSIQTNQAHTQRVHVKVTSTFDTTGYMQPIAITWSDGRTFPIEKVLEFRPAGMAGNDSPQDIFTVVIRKKEKALYFEHIDPRFTGRLGRWFIKKQAGSSEKAAGDSNKK